MIKGLKIEIDHNVTEMKCGVCGQKHPWSQFVKLVSDGFYLRFRFYVREPDKLVSGDITDARGFVVCKACDQKEE